jgi:hypothetical protein
MVRGDCRGRCSDSDWRRRLDRQGMLVKLDKNIIRAATRKAVELATKYRCPAPKCEQPIGTPFLGDKPRQRGNLTVFPFIAFCMAPGQCHYNEIEVTVP